MPVPSDPALKNRVENSPIYKNGKFRFNVDAQKVAFGKFASSTWEFFFNDIETTPKSGLPDNLLNCPTSTLRRPTS